MPRSRYTPATQTALIRLARGYRQFFREPQDSEVLRLCFSGEHEGQYTSFIEALRKLRVNYQAYDVDENGKRVRIVRIV
jgi:hypothetical protein